MEHVNEFEVQELSKKLENSCKTFAEFLAELFKDKFVEIYLGDAYEQVSIEQISIEYPAVFCGKVVGAYRECLVISAAYVDNNKQLKTGKLMFISERAIRTLSVCDGVNLEDMFLRSREASEIVKNFGR
jgi:hypothetical protein